MTQSLMNRCMLLVTAFTLATTPVAAQAQTPQRPPKPVLRRERLEQLYRQHGEQIVRKQLGLNEGQMRQLRQVNSQYAGRRRSLMQQQRSVQLALRAELARGPAADQRHVAQLNGQLNAVQRQRFELQQQERNDMGKFLSPVQQAQYQALQFRLRQKVQELQGVPASPPPYEAPAPPAP